MLRPCAYQAQGLQKLAQPLMPCMVAMASHHDPKAEYAMLHSLCTAWHLLGYRVALLDGLRAKDNGAADLLTDRAHASPDHDAAELASSFGWTTIPAYDGLGLFARSTPHGLWLTDELRRYDVVVAYASSDLLVRAIGMQDAQTLLAVSPDATSMLTAYQAMKTLLQSSHLQPLLVTPIHADACPPPILERLNHTLQSCAEQFLGHRLPVVTAHTLSDPEAAPQDLIGLALRLLEQAPSRATAAPVASFRIDGHAGSRVLQRSH